MGDVFRTVLSLSLSGSVLILATLLVGKLLKRHLSKRWQYYIWLVVALRLLLPFSFDFSFDSMIPAEQLPSASSQAAPSLRTGDGLEQDAANNPPPVEESSGSFSLSGVMNRLSSLTDTLWMLWLFLALALLIRKITLYQSFVKYIHAGKTEVSDPAILNVFGDICEELNVRRTIELYTNPLVSSPLLIGIRSPHIILPAIPAGEMELRYICLHELTHYKRGDILYKWLMQLVLCLHWFNPLVHWMVKATARACELSCDSAVIKRFSAVERSMYGDTLLDSLRNPGEYREGVAALTLSENASRLSERLQEIRRSPRQNKWLAMLSILLAAGLLFGGFSLGVYSAKAPEPSNRLSLLYDPRFTEVRIDHTTHPAPLDRNISVWDGSYPEGFVAVDSEAYTWDNAYAPTMLPEGYREEPVMGGDSLRGVRYLHGDGGEIYFSQTNGESSGGMSLDTENAQLVESVIINDSEGFLVNKDGRNSLLWSIGNQTLFLTSSESNATLLAIAGGIQPSDYTHLPDAIPIQKSLVEEFSASVEYDKQGCVLRFTIPKEIPPECTFNVWLNGNLKAGGGGMHIQLFRTESDSGDWEPGKIYTHTFEQSSLLDITILAEATLIDSPDTAYADNIYIDENGEVTTGSSESYGY